MTSANDRNSVQARARRVGKFVRQRVWERADFARVPVEELDSADVVRAGLAPDDHVPLGV